MKMKSIPNFFWAAVISIIALPSWAITNGELDGSGHPHVGILIFDVDGAPGWRCSGTMLSPTVMLTAGHCTNGATSGRVWFTETEDELLAQGYPFGGSGAIEFAEIHDSPDFNPAAFLLNDLGVVVLSEPVSLGVFGELPDAGQLNMLKKQRGLKNTKFTAVGYGLQAINPVFVESERSRMVAYPSLIQINSPGFTGDFSILLSNNHSTGGTCFGDSGGPNFLGDSNVIGGVTSFGINGNCAGTGGVYRMDRQHDLDWVKSFLP